MTSPSMVIKRIAERVRLRTSSRLRSLLASDANILTHGDELQSTRETKESAATFKSRTRKRKA